VSKPDCLEVSRKAHELVKTHGGWNAYAERQAERALAAGETKSTISGRPSRPPSISPR
jgi:hypothetical protein